MSGRDDPRAGSGTGPGALVVGVGVRSGVLADDIRTLLTEVLGRHGLDPSTIRGWATLDRRVGEPGLRAVAGPRLYGYPAAVLARVPVAHPSDRVARLVGTPAVAEAAALRAAADLARTPPPRTAPADRHAAPGHPAAGEGPGRGSELTGWGRVSLVVGKTVGTGVTLAVARVELGVPAPPGAYSGPGTATTDTDGGAERGRKDGPEMADGRHTVPGGTPGGGTPGGRVPGGVPGGGARTGPMPDPEARADRHYLVGLDLRDRLVVLVGGGSVVQRRAPRLLAAGARPRVISPSLTPAVEALAAAGDLEWIERRYAPGDLDGAWYALACTDDPDVNAAVVEEAERSRVFCVRADAGELGTAVTPAVGEHEELAVGVISGGDPKRSAAVRTALVEALHSGVIDDAAAPHAPGVALVGGGPGDPGLITVRGRRLLSRADLVVADRLAPQRLLEELPSHVEVIDAAKIPYGRAMRQEAINAALVDAAKAGKFVVRLKGGDPYVYGRGFEELQACVEAGVAVTVVPGVTSAFAAPAMAGVPVSHRGVAHEIVVVSGHVAPEDPTSLLDWSALGRLRGTLVLMMGVQRVEAFADVLQRHGRAPDTPVAVIQDGTLRGQRVLRSTLVAVAGEMAARGIRPPAVIVIGPVAGIAEAQPAARLRGSDG